MRNMNERPICHRAEDLVTYLYGEAGEADANDFASHMQLCDACRSEFAVFQQVHDSIFQWRSEALGAVSLAPALIETVKTPAQATSGSERRLSAPGAIREFFRLSPLWLRGAAALASVVFCVLVVLAVVRFSKQPTPVVGNNPSQTVYTPTQFKEAVAAEVEKQVAEIRKTQPPPNLTVKNPDSAKRARRPISTGSQLARQTHLTRRECEQLAADLRLVSSSDEDELPFVLPNEPNW